jgi:two-component system NtrC family sensor kinase
MPTKETFFQATRPRRFSISKVLLVEDNAEVATVATDYLSELDLEVVHASSAEAAIPLLSHDSHIGLVLSDIVMPGMTGLDLARHIRQQHPDLPIILATGYSDKADLAIADGFPLIKKPYSIDTLVAQMVRIIPTEPVRNAS